MAKAGLYLNDQRFEVAVLRIDYMHDRWKGSRRRRVPSLGDVRLTGRVFAPPTCDLNTLQAWDSVISDSAGPVKVKYRGLSGPFYIDAEIGRSITFTAVAAGPVTMRGGR